MRIVLAGNPNVGKSTVFNALTGMHQKTGNWPGKTVGAARGSFTADGVRHELIDLPGTYSLTPHSEEERITSDYLRGSTYDAAIVVCDAGCLERNLILAAQIAGLCGRVLLCVNLCDEAKRRGIRLDLSELSRRLSVPVVGITARRRRDIRRLRQAVSLLAGQALRPEHYLLSTAQAVMVAETACAACVEKSPRAALIPGLADRLLTGKLTAFPVMLLLLGLIFYLTMRGANYPSELLSAFLLHLGDSLKGTVLTAGLPPVLCSVLFDGVWRTTAWVVGVMMPPMLIFFPLFTFLEDLGYLPRVVFNLDRCFQGARSCGKQALTICEGFGCNAVGVTGCRIIDSPRERLIAILTNSLIPCNGRLPTMMLMITMFLTVSPLGSAGILTAVIVLGIAVTLLLSRLLSATLLKGQPSSFVLELPPYRLPQPGRILVRSFLDRGIFVLGRAVTVAAPAGVVLWLMTHVTLGNVPLLTAASDFLDPLGRLMGLNGVILLAFVLSMPANEMCIPVIFMAYTATGILAAPADTAGLHNLLSQHGWTAVTAVNTVLFSLMHWPCLTTLLTIRKETGSLRWTLLAFWLPTAAGFCLCMLVNLFLRFVI
ncbi:MAG: ferrous iron transporter B [Oscillospiraceae bacterium]|nr:ferrous iron transporter B [Oscillospiraceae bacterium]